MYTFYLNGYKLNLIENFTVYHNGKSVTIDMTSGLDLIFPVGSGITEYKCIVWLNPDELEEFESLITELIKSRKATEFVLNRAFPTGETFYGFATDVIVSGKVSYLEEPAKGLGIKVEFTLSEYVEPLIKEIEIKSKDKFNIKKTPRQKQVSETKTVDQPNLNVPEQIKQEQGTTQSAKEIKESNPLLWIAHGINKIPVGAVLNFLPL